jgi:ATP-dependent Clp protease ATP-binding subunit ClpA
MGFLLFDEIEKASDTLWQLLLGILDKAVLKLGDNSRVDLGRTVVLMTSNLGAGEMGRLVRGSIGFAPAPAAESEDSLARNMFRVAVDAARRRFSPEFMNRLDKVIVFRTLTREHLRQILELELNEVYARIISSQGEKTFVLNFTEDAKDFLLNEGTDPRYGARHLKRAIERHVVFPLSSLISTGQIDPGEAVLVTLDNEALSFSKDRPRRTKKTESSN